MGIRQNSIKHAKKIPIGIEERIVELSSEHPDYGPHRLGSSLEQEGIQVTTTAVYTILKRNDLRTKSKRLAILDSLRSVERPLVPASTTPSEIRQQDQVPFQTTETEPKPRISAPIKALKKTNPRRPWSLSVPNLVLLGIIGYFWISAIGDLLNANRQPFSVPSPPTAEVSSKLRADVRPLEDYTIITERNLFGISEEVSVPQDELDLEGLPVSLKVAGLKLVGTVASKDSTKSFAILDNLSTRKQELYREGDKVGEALVRKILRSKVVLNTDKGDEVLTMELKHSGESVKTSPAHQLSTKRWPSPKEEGLRFDRAEVESSLANVDQLTQVLNISPFVQVGKPSGFLIGKIPNDSILSQMGLMAGDIIVGVNDQEITSPDQAAEFFQKLKRGGDVTIKVRKNRGVRRRSRLIKLKID